MRNISIKLRNINHLQDLNSIVLALYQRIEFENDDGIYCLNLRDLLKKLADKIYSYSTRLSRKITLSIEINQFNALKKLFVASDAFLIKSDLMYFRTLLIDVMEQGRVCFELKYFFEVYNSKNLTI